MHARWYDLALRLSKDSPHPKHRLAAVIVKSGVVLAVAVNGQSRGQHAERRALRYCRSPRGATVYVAREGQRMSRPCPLCLQALADAGVTTMVYAGWNHQLVSEPVVWY